MQTNRFRVLVADDSAFMRKYITDLLEEDPGIKVVGIAVNGLDAVEKMAALDPDVITMDIEMPVMDGLKSLRAIMERKPTPVVMLSNHTQIGADSTIKALELGAVDFVPKPSGNVSLDLKNIQEELIAKVKVAARAKRVIIPDEEIRETARQVRDTGRKIGLAPKELDTCEPHCGDGNIIIAIGASTGGPRALQSLLSGFDPGLPAAIVIAQHMPARFTKALAMRLDEVCALPVKEAEHGEQVVSGMVYISPGSFHLQFKEKSTGYYINLLKNETGTANCPSVDMMMMSLAQCRVHKIGVLLTGMGKDGAQGLKMIKETGGMTIAEDETSCTIYGMPKAAVETGCVDFIEPVSVIAKRIKELLISLSGGSRPWI